MEKDGWNTGILRLYDILSLDYLYRDPSHIVVFADNHDVDRYLNSQKDDIRKLKMAMAFILTSRGIPEIYYGTETLLTTGVKNGDGGKRGKTFPEDGPAILSIPLMPPGGLLCKMTCSKPCTLC